MAQFKHHYTMDSSNEYYREGSSGQAPPAVHHEIVPATASRNNNNTNTIFDDFLAPTPTDNWQFRETSGPNNPQFMHDLGELDKLINCTSSDDDFDLICSQIATEPKYEASETQTLASQSPVYVQQQQLSPVSDYYSPTGSRRPSDTPANTFYSYRPNDVYITNEPNNFQYKKETAVAPPSYRQAEHAQPANVYYDVSPLSMDQVMDDFAESEYASALKTVVSPEPIVLKVNPYKPEVKPIVTVKPIQQPTTEVKPAKRRRTTLSQDTSSDSASSPNGESTVHHARHARRKETNRRASAKYRERQINRKQSKEQEKRAQENIKIELERDNYALHSSIDMLLKQFCRAVKNGKV